MKVTVVDSAYTYLPVMAHWDGVLPPVGTYIEVPSFGGYIQLVVCKVVVHASPTGDPPQATVYARSSKYESDW